MMKISHKIPFENEFKIKDKIHNRKMHFLLTKVAFFELGTT